MFKKHVMNIASLLTLFFNSLFSLYGAWGRFLWNATWDNILSEQILIDLYLRNELLVQFQYRKKKLCKLITLV